MYVYIYVYLEFDTKIYFDQKAIKSYTLLSMYLVC